MMKRLLLLLPSVLLAPTAALADTATSLCNGADIGTSGCAGDNGTALTNSIGTGVNLLLFIAGALAVIVVIYGGIRYVTSTGDSARVKAAKDTIVYGIAGLVIAILAYAIVKFVTANVK